MSVVTVRPNGSTGSSGTLSPTGAGTLHEALADDSDSSYVNAVGLEDIVLQFPDLSLPADAIIRSVGIRFRAARVSSWAPSVEQRLELSGNPLIWAATTVTWTTATTVTGIATTSPFAGGEWTEPTINAVDLVLRTPAFAGDVNVFEAYLDVMYVEQPVTDVTGPSGTLTDTNKPTITWSNTLDSDGGVQSYWACRVFSQAQYEAGGFDPAVSSSVEARGSAPSSPTSSVELRTALPDGTYRAYVQVGQLVGGAYHLSDWDYVEFEIDVDVPDPPSLVVTGLDAEGCIQLEVDEAGGAATTDAIELQRSLDGGVTWEPVRLPVA